MTQTSRPSLLSPYRGFSARNVTRIEGTDRYHGEVDLDKDVVTFEGTIPKLKKAFQDSVDDYLDMTASLPETPKR